MFEKIPVVAFTCLSLFLGSVLFFQAPQPASGERQPASQSPASQKIDRELARFYWNGKPIHPGVIYELNTDLSNSYPLVASVDVEGACESQRFFDPPVKRDAWLYYKNKEEFTGSGGFGYRYLGHSSDGKHVLLTEENDGGTGYFQDVLIVRFSRDRVDDNGHLRARVLMTLVGSFILGDRNDGIVSLHGDDLFIGKSRYRKTDRTVSLTRDIPG